ncbi:MAG TPA: electron transport complex subunit RsxC [Pseudomonadales bacterium]|nr:electron transport complex subunit RsxC [Pseudomonadales bacterium]
MAAVRAPTSVPGRAPVRSLPGGIHPPEEKALSQDVPIRRPALPARLVIPLQQHVGAPAEAVVVPGQRVLKGEQIAAARGWVSVPQHAPTSGTVLAIADLPAPHASGLPAPCIVIEPDGRDAWAPRHPVGDWRHADTELLLETIRSAGIAGLGGAGFPTAVKLSAREGHPIDTLILNGAECEPYITADDRIMRERADGIIAGLEILAHLVRPARCLIGIEDNKPEAIAAIGAAIAGLEADAERPPIEIVVVPTRYPSGGEKQLIQLLTGLEVPSGGLPSDLGILCQNVATAWAVHRAVAHGEPVLSRITTLTGRALARPGNLEVLLGTPFSHLLADAGLRPEALGRLIMGGPMMGFTVDDPEVGVVKTTNCILAASLDELPAPPPAQPCIRCGMCEQACPASLLPQQLYWYARDDDFEAARDHDLADCIECGACAWVCPSAIPLVQYYRYAKGEIRRQKDEALRAEHARERFEFHQARTEAELRERDARRQARQEAARARAAAEAPATPPAQAAGEAALIPTRVATAADEVPSTDARHKQLETLAARLDKAERDLATAREAGDADRADKLQAKHDSLAGRVAELRTTLQVPAPTPTPDRPDRPDADAGAAAAATPPPAAVRASAPPPRAVPTPAQRRAQLDTLQSRRRRLDTDLDQARAGDDAAAVDRIRGRIEDLDHRIAVLCAEVDGVRPHAGPGAATPYVDRDEAELERLSAEAERAHARVRKARSALAALEQGGAEARKLGAMRASLERLEDTAAAADAALAEFRGVRPDAADHDAVS